MNENAAKLLKMSFMLHDKAIHTPSRAAYLFYFFCEGGSEGGKVQTPGALHLETIG